MESMSPGTNAGIDNFAKQPKVTATVEAHSRGIEYVLRFLVVASGIILGGIAAVIIGFITGWIGIC